LHFVGEGKWSDESVLAKVRELVMPATECHGPIEAWIIDDTSYPKHVSPANIRADGHKEKPMIRSYALVATAAFLGFAITGMGFAQQGGQPPPPARGLDTALAVEAAQTAVNTCLDSGVKGSAAVVVPSATS
jgi:hypothetical protein